MTGIPLVNALGQTHYWQRLQNEGKYNSFAEIAEACLSGQSAGLALERLMRQGVSREWGMEGAGDDDSLVHLEI